PTTPTAFQQFYSGAAQDEDAFIAIFNPDHTLKYCSYFGGIGNDNLTEMVFHNDKLFFCGTSFADNMQGTIGSHQQLHAGSLDGFIGCLDLSGNIEWLTMYGTNEYDAILGLAVINNKVVCVGSTASGEYFTTTDATQPNNAGGFDAFMLVMSIDGQVEYCTLMGTSEADQAWRINGDSQGNIYIMGQSSSPTGMSTSGSLQEENAGGSDLFIAQFDSNYQLNWSTYFGGSGFETGMDMMVDSNDRLWVSGTSTSNNLPISNNALYSTPHILASFVLHMNTQGELLWSSYVGESSGTSLNNITEWNNHIVLSGYTNYNNLPTSSNASQSSLQGNHDGFIMLLNQDYELIYCTYYGGNLSERQQLADARNGLLYLFGTTESTQQMTTPNAYQFNILNPNSFEGYIAIMDITNGIADGSIPTSLLTVYPQPANNLARIESSTPMYYIQVMDLAGHIVLEKSGLSVLSETLQLSQLNTGIYLLRIHGEKGGETKKLVVQH
ncbi:MAG TPA: T9SS type A sorting domain-containing protein, partial [Flavobacteriales bacterium]